MPLTSRDVLFVLRAQDFASREVHNLANSFAAANVQMQLGARDMRRVEQAGKDAFRQSQALGDSFGVAGNKAKKARTEYANMRIEMINTGREMMNTGAALAAIGAGMAISGAAITYAFGKMTSDAIEFRQQVALAVTQGEEIGATLENVGDIALDTAQKIPRPIEQMNEVLYDIYSSIDVTIPESRKLLEQFAKGAVAGQVEIRESARSTIAVMNAWQTPVEDINDIMDTQFRLVERGVGTYDEFAGVIGRAIPAAVRFNQEFETLAASLAFLTRRGLSPEMAATSTARTMELLADPKSVANLEEMGIVMRDAEGNFSPMVDILRQMADRLGNLTGPERSEALKDIFGGAGYRIQARRFLDTVIPAFGAFEHEVERMDDRAGAMDRAYDIMFEQPQSQIERMKNNIEVLGIAIGDALIPVLEPVADAVENIVTWFRNLDEDTQALVVRIVAAIGAFTMLSGTVLGVVGAMMALKGALMVANLFGGSLLVLGGVALGVAAAIAAIGAVVWLVIDNWETIKEVASNVWNAVRDAVVGAYDAVVDYLRPGWQAFTGWLVSLWEGLSSTASNAWDAVVNAFTTAGGAIMSAVDFVVEHLKSWWEDWGDSIVEFASKTWGQVTDIFQSAGDIISVIWDTMVDSATAMWNTLAQLFGRWGPIIAETWSNIWDNIVTAAKVTWRSMVDFFRATLDFFVELWNQFSGTFSGLFTRLWNDAGRFLAGAWQAIQNIITGALGIITGVFDIFAGLLTLDWQRMWDGIIQILGGAWRIAIGILQGAWAIVEGTIRTGLNILRGIFQAAWDFITALWKSSWDWMSSFTGIVAAAILGAIETVIDGIVGVFRALWSTLSDIWARLWGGLKSAFARIANTILGNVETFINGIISAINGLITLLNKLPGVSISKMRAVTISRAQESYALPSSGSVNYSPDVGRAYHDGGVVMGRGEVPARLLGGEGILNRKAMATVGGDRLRKLNEGSDIYELVPGKRGKGETGDFLEDVFSMGKKAMQAAFEKLVEPVLSSWDGGFISGGISGLVRLAMSQLFDKMPTAPALGGGVGWQKMWAVVKQMFPQAVLTSAFRPGAITATGNRSYHGMGRAIDISPIMEIFNFLRARYKSVTKELIFSPAGNRQVHNGSDHYYSGVTRGDHWGHIHWAMAQGGIVTKPTRALIGEAGPEAVIPLSKLRDGTFNVGGANIDRMFGGVPNLNNWLDKFGPKYSKAMDTATSANLDSVKLLTGAMDAIRQHIGAQRGLREARDQVGALTDQVHSLRKEARDAQAELAQAWREARKVTAEEELGIIKARQQVRTAQQTLKEYTSGARALSTELDILNQEQKVDDLRQALHDLQNPDLSEYTEQIAEARAAVETAKANLAGAQFNVPVYQEIAATLDDRYAGTMLVIQAESELAAAQETLKKEQAALNKITEQQLPTARDLRIAEIELALAEQELIDKRGALKLLAEGQKIAELELAISRRDLTQTQRDAVGATNDVREAEEHLKEVQEELAQSHIDLQAAITAVKDAEYEAISGVLGLIEAGQSLQDVAPQHYAYFRELAKQAGVAASTIAAVDRATKALAGETKLGTQRESFSQLAGIARSYGINYGAYVDPADKARLASVMGAGPNASVNALLELNKALSDQKLRRAMKLLGVYSGSGPVTAAQVVSVKDMLGVRVGRTLDPGDLEKIVAAVTAIEKAYKDKGLSFGAVLDPGDVARYRKFDSGGMLMPGLTLAYNATGRPERVLPPGKSAGSTITINSTLNFNGDVTTDVLPQVERAIEGAFDKIVLELDSDYAS